MATKVEVKKVLLVEDDILISDILARKLSQNGLHVFHAPSGRQAFEILKTTTPDVILLDLMLPGMNGFEILEKLKADKTQSTIPVIILSNNNEPDQIEKAKRLGALDYLIKIEVPLEDIVSRVNSICGA